MYKIYRNLKPGMAPNCWSYKLNKTGETVSHAVTITARNVTIKQPSGKAFNECLQGGYRAVFAWFKSDNVQVNNSLSIPSEAKRIRFNPKNGDKWFHIDGIKVDFLRKAYLDGNGNAWGVI